MDGARFSVEVSNAISSATSQEAVLTVLPTTALPVAHWKFDEGSGTSASDSSGNGNTGVLTNGVQWGAGKLSNAVSFDGVDDYVRVNDSGTNSALDLRGDFTISAWVQFTQLSPVGTSRYPRILQKSARTNDAGSYYLAANMANQVSLRIKFQGTVYTLEGSRALTAGQWYHLAAVKGGTVVRLYVDGIQDGPDFTVPAGAPDANNDPLYIGEAPLNSDGATNGKIDDVRLYSRALSGSEIISLL